MNNAKVSTSKRLQRVVKALATSDLTTRQIIKQTGSCAVSSIISELRCQGFDISCKQLHSKSDSKIFQYSLKSFR